MRVACTGHVTLRLVHHDVHLILALEPFSVETDVILDYIDFRAKFGDHDSIHGDHTGKNEVVGLPPGADSGIRDEFVETYLLLDRSRYGVVVRICCVVNLRLLREHQIDSFLVCLGEMEIVALSRFAVGRTVLLSEAAPVSRFSCEIPAVAAVRTVL